MSFEITTLSNYKNSYIMKNYFNTKFSLALILFVISLGLSHEVFAQGSPPPPGVPLDFGLSAFIAACVSYGIVKIKSNKKDDYGSHFSSFNLTSYI